MDDGEEDETYLLESVAEHDDARVLTDSRFGGHMGCAAGCEKADPAEPSFDLRDGMAGSSNPESSYFAKQMKICPEYYERQCISHTTSSITGQRSPFDARKDTLAEHDNEKERLLQREASSVNGCTSKAINDVMSRSTKGHVFSRDQNRSHVHRIGGRFRTRTSRMDSLADPPPWGLLIAGLLLAFVARTLVVVFHDRFIEWELTLERLESEMFATGL
eukprot:CAMPEP_0114245690 /NCGR_PEP_ID=MMETSP0058-20121206/12043_1 /TAXON_ID=36894 /ORGANISM="Pyramimonas parkeae, CCMP726" /LENGTH=217 /DNA_ID=CAMNT_0001358785 /DNA_START=438 /DNA_END=1091 /DNA_ORIENTATION=+